MSDKSFGDHLNRNIVKNPLLSTAVTGLSIEDLTHNAVLLPAAPSQELTTSHGQQIGPQIAALAHVDRKNDNHPSGDANSNILHLHHTPPSNLSTPNAQHNRENVSKQNTTVSKALPKSDDDFDVNEYFARLQGTRYVSAPLNSLLKEDEQSNLEATEENLEEINLNEPEKAQDAEVQQSLTADIAQNFSQLPTVLPQVASAVFSSFSNMLNMKSREQTPGVVSAKPVYHEVDFAKPEDTGVPLMGIDEPIPQREVAPPPTEPPVGGTTSYRIATKKKAYAQIPGLSSTNTPHYNPAMQPAQINVPSEIASNFAPQQSQINISAISDSKDSIANLVPPQTNLFHQHTGVASNSADINIAAYKQEYNLFTPYVPDNTQVINDETIKEYNVFHPAAEEQKVLKETNVLQEKPTSLFTTVEQTQAHQTHGAANAPIIPPPPMFSNVPNKETQANVKSVLPPSVARRIGSHHPIIKPQTLPPTLVPKDNIFVPAPLSDQAAKAPVSESTSFPNEATTEPFVSDNSSATLGSAFVHFNAASPTTEKSKLLMTLESSSNSPHIPFTPEMQSETKSETQTATSKMFPQNVLHSETAAPPPMFFNPSNLTATSIEPIPSSLSSDKIVSNVTQMPPLPTLFNPNAATQYSQTIAPPQFGAPSQSFDQNTTEVSKPVPEPPKLSGNLNYRMQKKRPQYYSGPIEGVGSISNNVKPTIPALEPNVFEGSLFTPEVKEVSEQQPILNINPAVIPQQTIAPAGYPQFDLNMTQKQSFIGADYNTAFDMSRQTTDDYEMPKPESKGFGIIGSLKSKLSSLDINKIQNTVTTFFDPAYNDTKVEERNAQAQSIYNDNNTYGFNSNQDSSLEVFVPNLEQNNPVYNENYGQFNYQHPYNYGQANQQYQNQPYDYGNQAQSYTTPDLYTGYSQNTFSAQNYEPPATNLYDPARSIQTSLTDFSSKTVAQENINKSEVELTPNPTMTGDDHDDEIISELSTGSQGVIGSKELIIGAHSGEDGKRTNVKSFFGCDITNSQNDKGNFEMDSTESKEIGAFVVSQQLFNLSQPIDTGNLSKKLENLQIAQGKEATVSSDTKPDNVGAGLFSNMSDLSTGIDFQPTTVTGNYFTNFPSQDAKDAGHLQSSLFDSTQSDADIGGFGSSYFQCGNDYKNVLKEEDDEDVPCKDSTAMPLFGLPNILTDGSDPIINIRGEMNSISRFGAVEKPHLGGNVGTADVIKENEPIANDENLTSDFNICETCREVNVPEDKDADDLTSQLIENVTAPIQLLNPVVAPLTEISKKDEDTSFEPNQCAEISHITEETIETIQVQSATELLEDENEEKNDENMSYGWNTTNDALFNPAEALLDHDYNFQIDPNAIGFFSNNSLFFEDIPNNASDEIKAEFKNTHEETPLFLPRQMSIPTAPPAEDDDTKSDETGGLDVHSIEQDAKMDFPIYEEFVIEPSETDDDKIEYRERERSSEDPIQNVDTFTDRVERFKKMEETDKCDDIFSLQKSQLFDMNNPTSPAIPIASYFDTGNYAADTHYRNSISSPTSIFNVGSPNDPLRIPPGFEEEYKRRMSVLSLRGNDKKSDKDDNVPYIPDTSTQTRPVTTTSYSMVSNKPQDITVTSKIQLISRTQELMPSETKNLNQTVPEVTTLQEQMNPSSVSSMFGQKPESGDGLASSLFSKIDKELAPLLPLKTEEKTEPDKIQTLADPISFFSSKEETPIVANDNNFNRLASYFTSPAKTDHGKSFFELSQSQNHYRHATSNIDSSDKQTPNLTNRQYKSITESKEDLQNIPRDVFIDKLKLMSDLTSSQNLTINPVDQIVRTVNYFTVEYDNDELKSGFNIGEPDLKKVDKVKLDNDNDDAKLEESELCDDKRVMMVVSKCKYCCNNDFFGSVKKLALDNEFKVRKAMDSDCNNKDNRTESRVGMDQRSEDRAKEVAVSFEHTMQEENDGAATTVESRASSEYSPVKHHWFYRVDFEGKSIWRGFSATDNRALEDAFANPDLDEQTVVATDGGRFDVNIVGRLRTAVYWADKPTNVRRCSWFYKGTTDARYVPYTEAVAEKLEEEYRRGITTGQWHRRLVLPSGSAVVMHGPCVMVQLCAPDPPAPESNVRPRVVRRGCEESEVEDPEPSSVDHLLLLCHGVGSACDMRFRSVQEVVDDFRATSLQLLQGHYRNSYDKGIVNRVEVLPISWHASLHSGETGVDRRLSAITLDSIPRLRSFTNDTVLDVLFYTSPVFCQTIIDTVCAELNRIYKLFISRTPSFNGRVSLGGHSLGSVILYDLLCHQTLEGVDELKSYVEGSAGTGQGAVRYPSLAFRPAALYALGSPIAMFECIRGVKSLGDNFKLPTCQNFFNIFHPYDPIAYRIEPLINAQLGSVKPYLIPHHKGRKRMHLELKDTMARVGADIKQKLIESLKSTWSSMWKSQPPPHDAQLEKVVEEEIEKEQLCAENKDDAMQNEIQATPDLLGSLNGGRRVDYVLQETPLEMINEYLFAMSSHVCYWESEDTMLLILREIYDSLGVAPDSTVPQQSLTVQRQRPTKSNETYVVNTSEYPSTSRDGT